MTDPNTWPVPAQAALLRLVDRHRPGVSVEIDRGGAVYLDGTPRPRQVLAYRRIAGTGVSFLIDAEPIAPIAAANG